MLFAQSTQSRYDELTLPDNVVVKIPPHHKIIAGGHLLNLANAPYSTELRMNLEIVHPREVPRQAISPRRAEVDPRSGPALTRRARDVTLRAAAERRFA